MAAAALLKSIAVSTLTRNNALPFVKGNYMRYVSPGAAVMYGVNSPGSGSATKYAAFKQTRSGNKAFELPSGVNTPQNTTGSALSDANQLRVVALVNDAVTAGGRARGDQVAPTNAFIVAAGGGTAAGQSGLVTDGTNTAGASALVFKRGDAGTQTVLVGDRITVAGDPTTYYATATTTSLNGTTGVSFAITPPLQTSPTAGTAVTVAAATGKTIIFNQTIPVGAKVEIWVNDAADITQITGGTFTANVIYQAVVFDVTWNTSAALVNVMRL